MDYLPVIGLEIHAQLNTKSKLFCNCANSFGSVQNENTCVICQAYPGTLPVLNKEAYKKALQTALVLDCKIKETTLFDRKHYFYPDLPKGYQISQFYHPFCSGGKLDIELDDNKIKSVFLDHIHIEEDAGKLIHEPGGESYVDLNRSGVPLIEIVTKPNMNSVMEVHQFLVRLRKILRYVDVSDCDMEKGGFRCDVNISVKTKEATELGPKVEIKNLNSFRHIQKAMDYEIQRQIEILEQGGKVHSETRLFNTLENKTNSMRDKYSIDDYYYFPEPDLPKYTVSKEQINELKQSIPELPQQKEQRWMQEFGMSKDSVSVLSETPQLARYFEDAVVVYPKNPKKIANWIQSELLKIVQHSDCHNFFPVSAEHLACLVSKVDSKEISGKMAKSIFEEMCQFKLGPADAIKKLGIKLIDSSSQIELLISQVLDKNPNVVESYYKGKITAIGFLVGEVMKLSKGQANPTKVNEIMKQRLS